MVTDYVKLEPFFLSLSAIFFVDRKSTVSSKIFTMHCAEQSLLESLNHYVGFSSMKVERKTLTKI